MWPWVEYLKPKVMLPDSAQETEELVTYRACAPNRFRDRAFGIPLSVYIFLLSCLVSLNPEEVEAENTRSDELVMN